MYIIILQSCRYIFLFITNVFFITAISIFIKVEKHAVRQNPSPSLTTKRSNDYFFTIVFFLSFCKSLNLRVRGSLWDYNDIAYAVLYLDYF